MKPIVKRTISGIGIIAVFIVGILINQYTFSALFSLFLIMAMYEFHQMLKKKDIHIPFIYSTAIALILFSGNFLVALELIPSKMLLFIIPLTFGVYIIGLFSKDTKSFTNITYTLFGILYIAVPISLLNYIVFSGSQKHEYNFRILLGFTILIWVYDTFAYLFGIWLGKHRLFERISPLKSWEGFIGGGLATIGSAFIINYFLKELTIYNWIIISAITVIMGTLGDLLESMLKRNLEIKDSSSIIPGHGGVLDRFDSFMIISPFVFLYLQFI